MRRILTSQLPGFPSGVFEGTATFTPSNAFNKSAYLYHETGILTTDQGVELTASRKYIYRFSQEDDKLSTWFVKDVDGGDEVDYLYHELEFGYENNGWIAYHLCEKDVYRTYYDFRLNEAGTTLLRWGMKHKVTGPNKDYSSDTAYHRPGNSADSS